MPSLLMPSIHGNRGHHAPRWPRSRGVIAPIGLLETNLSKAPQRRRTQRSGAAGIGDLTFLANLVYRADFACRQKPVEGAGIMSGFFQPALQQVHIEVFADAVDPTQYARLKARFEREEGPGRSGIVALFYSFRGRDDGILKCNDGTIVPRELPRAPCGLRQYSWRPRFRRWF